jgi:hypothetical protein
MVLVLLAPASARASFGRESYERERSQPTRPPAQADLVVPADSVQLPFTIRVRNPEVDRAVFSQRMATEELLKKAKAEVGEAVELKVRNLSSQEADKSSRGQATVEHVAEGELEVALPAGDFWARAKIVSALEKLARDVEAATREGKPGYFASFGQLQPRVRDAEAHRAALLKVWAGHVRELVDAAGGQQLQFSLCEAPGRVAQRAVSQEEIELSLEISCRLAFSRAGK